ncbi:MAG: 4-(cytidine 5'-diphospho)-2-C-methyl-D-erythritol kinase [Desulfobacterales bacterium]
MKILSPAKINLFLQITGKRPDGYHELFSLMCCLSLFDVIFLQFGGPKIEIDASTSQIPLDETNLVHKAATLFFKKLRVTGGLSIRIEKSIPVAGGLGGGSSNAASTLLGLNQHYGSPFSRDELMSLGRMQIHRNDAIGTGKRDHIGNQLGADRHPGRHFFILPYHVLLINPGVKVHTGEVFQNLNLRLTKCKKIITKPSLKQSGFDASLHLCNDLETVTISQDPIIESLKKQLLSHGALGALMSGSGPTVFGLFSDPHAAGEAARAIGQNTRVNTYLSDIIDEAFPAIFD